MAPASVISGQGHEGAQVGIVSALRRGHDWVVPFYRSIAACLTFGMTARDIMLAQDAKALVAVGRTAHRAHGGNIRLPLCSLNEKVSG